MLILKIHPTVSTLDAHLQCNWSSGQITGWWPIMCGGLHLQRGYETLQKLRFWGLSTDNSGPRHSHTVKNGIRDWAPERLNAFSRHPSEVVAEMRIGLWHLPFSDPGRILSYHNFTSHTEHSATVHGRLSQIHTGQEQSWQAEYTDLILFGFLMRLPGVPTCCVVG